MSIEDLKKYEELCHGNEDIHHKALEIGNDDVDGHIAHAKSLGLTISRDDLDGLSNEADTGRGLELNDDDMDNVAGGARPPIDFRNRSSI